MTPLSTTARACLLRLARASIEQTVRADSSLSAVLARTEIAPELEERRGAFVSLKQLRPEELPALRGCIGNITSRQPLHRNVVEMAAKAACEDPRFRPVEAEELERLFVELSVLAPLSRLERPEDLVIGRDGVQLVRGQAYAVFLPQVAKEQGWTVEQLLRQLAVKAGLAEDRWKGAELSVFRAEVFREEALLR